MYLAIIILPLLGSIASGFFGRKIGVTGAQFITWRQVFIIIRSYIIYHLVKLPINVIIFSTLDNIFLAYVLALLISCFITLIVSTSDVILDHMDICKEYVLNNCLNHIVIVYNTIIMYSPSLLLITKAEFITMPRLPVDMYARACINHNRILNQVYRDKEFAMHIRRLDMVAGAMNDDRSDPKHGALYDSITSYVNPIKKDLKDLYEEGLRYSLMADDIDGIHYERSFRHDTSGVWAWLVNT